MTSPRQPQSRGGSDPEVDQWANALAGAGTDEWMQQYQMALQQQQYQMALQQQQQQQQAGQPQQAADQRPRTRGPSYLISEDDENEIQAAAATERARGKLTDSTLGNYIKALRTLARRLQPPGRRLVDLDDRSLREAAERWIPDASAAVNMLSRHRGSQVPADGRSDYIVSPEDEALIRGAENAAKRRGVSGARNHSSLLRQLADGLRHHDGLTLGVLDAASLKAWSRRLLPRNNYRIGAALRQLEQHRADERAKNNRQAGEGSSHQAAPVPMEGFDQGEGWGGVDHQAPAGSFNSGEFWEGVDQAGQLPAGRFGSFDTENVLQGLPSSSSPAQVDHQAPAGSFNSGEFWAGVDQAGQLPADRFGSFDPENPSPAQSVNQSSPPMSDQGSGSWLFGAVDFGEYLPPNWDNGIQADITMLRQMHYNNVLPDEYRQMTTITVRGQPCTAVYNGRSNQLSDVRIYRQY